MPLLKYKSIPRATSRVLYNLTIAIKMQAHPIKSSNHIMTTFTQVRLSPYQSNHFASHMLTGARQAQLGKRERRQH